MSNMQEVLEKHGLRLPFEPTVIGIMGRFELLVAV
jgi:hypothetical protein